MGNHTHRVILTSAYLRAVRGQNMSKGESPIKLAVQWLQQAQGTRQKNLDESDASYLDAHKQVMRETTRKAVKTPKKRTQQKSTRIKKRKFDFRGTSDFLETYEWRKLRMQVLLRYGPRCMCCGATPQTGAVMNVDHIKPRVTHPELALDAENLQILCNSCNHGKGNWDTTDWRPKPA
jgi:5-methylcytosine-specific restriction endonuclease McrA